jgi:hypothetical protein
MWLAQIGGDWTWIAWFILLVIFFFFYPRLMVTQIMWNIEKTARKIEMMSEDAKKFIAKQIGGNVRADLDRFYEFFVIEPVALDPYGIVAKIDHIIKNEEERFENFVAKIAPKVGKEKQMAILMGLAAGISLYDIAKIVRHYVELVRKIKNIQIAMILQMQLPLIERTAKALFSGTKTLAVGQPIGDGAGPLIAARLIGKAKTRPVEKDIVAAKINLKGRNVIVLRAPGPGGRIGRPGKAVEKIVKRQKIAKIITIDAATKLEGERTGSVAEGVGVALGGPGTEKSYIEDIATKKGIPLDSILIKMSAEEAIMPMRAAIVKAWPSVKECILRSIENVKVGQTVILACIGNSSGIGNGQQAIENVEKIVERYEKSIKEKKELI